VKELVSELTRHSRTSIWSRFNVFLGVALAAGLVVVIAYQNLPWVKEKEAQDARVAQLEDAVAKGNMMNRRLNGEIVRLQNDPEYLGVFARDRLVPGFMKSGERIFRVDRDTMRKP
jgi:cell division protein FtsB